MTAMSPLLNGQNRNGLLRYQTTCPSTKPTCWISIIVRCSLVHPIIGPIGLTKARVKHSHFYVKNNAVENKSLITNLTEIIHVKSEKTRIDRFHS
jgi:hypothetical protein